MFGGEGTGLPEGIESVPIGPELGSILAAVDRERLSGYERVVLLRARSRLRAHVEAEMMADMVALVEAETVELPDDAEIDQVFDVAVSEIGAALSWTRRASQTQLDFAMTLIDAYPKVWEMLRAGKIDVPKTKVICNQTVHLDPEVRDRVVDIALERAQTQTTGLLAARIRRLAIWVDPESAGKKYEHGLEDRRVAREANEDGTANLFGLNMPASGTAAAMRRINRMARAARAAGDPRTMDQIRADVFMDLLHGRNHHSNGRDRAVVDIQVDLTTLTGLDENPGDVPGWGPVISDIARQVVDEQPDSEWRFTVTDQDGEVVANGTTRRRPDTVLARRVQARAPTCVFPGCRMPARDCDIDHNRAWAKGGLTIEKNLAPLCRQHHRVKHLGWRLSRIGPGTVRWISPLGHSYTIRPRAP